MQYSETPVEPKPVTASKPVSVAQAYTQWQNDRAPESMRNLVDALAPTVSYKLAAMGVTDNPQMRHQARAMTADAIRKFDPGAGVSLATWTQSHLQGMNRFRREHQGPVKIPDRAALDAWTIEKAVREFTDEFAREPDVRELADRTKMSVKRIAAVRKATRPVASDSQMHTISGSSTDFMGEALEYLYDDLDYVDRRIVEHLTGYGGAEYLQKNQIAERLAISPSQVTRRTERISQRLQELEQQLEDSFV